MGRGGRTAPTRRSAGPRDQDVLARVPRAIARLSDERRSSLEAVRAIGTEHGLWSPGPDLDGDLGYRTLGRLRELAAERARGALPWDDGLARLHDDAHRPRLEALAAVFGMLAEHLHLGPYDLSLIPGAEVGHGMSETASSDLERHHFIVSEGLLRLLDDIAVAGVAAHEAAHAEADDELLGAYLDAMTRQLRSARPAPDEQHRLEQIVAAELWARELAADRRAAELLGVDAASRGLRVVARLRGIDVSRVPSVEPDGREHPPVALRIATIEAVGRAA